MCPRGSGGSGQAYLLRGRVWLQPASFSASRRAHNPLKFNSAKAHESRWEHEQALNGKTFYHRCHISFRPHFKDRIE
jgi:hypothetical protein